MGLTKQVKLLTKVVFKIVTIFPNMMEKFWTFVGPNVTIILEPSGHELQFITPDGTAKI